MGMSGGSMGHSVFGDSSTEKRYNLTFSVSARNLFNTTNAGTPVGNLTSPLFGQSLGSASSYGSERAQAGNRRLEFTLKLSF